MKITYLFLLVLTSFLVTALRGQQIDWNGNPENDTIQEFTRAIIRKMATAYDCSKYAYGKERYQQTDIYSYAIDSNQIQIQFRFEWYAPYWRETRLSYTLGITSALDGCGTEVKFLSNTGYPNCNCLSDKKYSLECIWDTGH